MEKSKRTHKQNKKASPKFPLLLVLGGLIVLMAALIFAFQKPASPYEAEIKGSPALKVDQEKVDLGNVKLGQPVRVDYKLTNVGDQTLTVTSAPIVEVKEGC